MFEQQQPPKFRNLYPELTEEQIDCARDNVRRYLEIICRIQERLKAEGKCWPTLEEARTVYGFPHNLTDQK